MKRAPEVIDCCLNSGSMPFAQVHYPTENKEEFDKVLKQADYIWRESTRPAAGSTACTLSQRFCLIGRATKTASVWSLCLSAKARNEQE